MYDLRRVSFLFLLLILILSTPVARAGEGGPEQRAASLRSSILYGADTGAVEMAGSRNIPLAFGLSAAVPGLGQAYNGQWVKAAVAVALEAAFIAGYFNYRSRGKDAEEAYKAYAHAHWSPARYAEWLEDYSDWLPATERAEINVPSGIDFTNPDGWTAEQRSAVRNLFDQIRAVEGDVYHPETGAAFSHKLPYFAEQQYYELIGKYYQFAPGWDDYPEWVGEDGYNNAIDPERTGPGYTKPNIQGRFLEYARDHAHANDLLRNASRISALIVVNHLVAAIDAAVFAKLHNDRLSTQISLSHDPVSGTRPVASLRLTL